MVKQFVDFVDFYNGVQHNNNLAELTTRFYNAKLVETYILAERIKRLQNQPFVVPKFRAQSLFAKDYAHLIKNRKWGCKPLFLQNSIFKDNLLYFSFQASETSVSLPNPVLFGWVEEGFDKRLCKVIEDHKAEVVTLHLKLPPKTHFSGGYTALLEKDDFVLKYNFRSEFVHRTTISRGLKKLFYRTDDALAYPQHNLPITARGRIEISGNVKKAYDFLVDQGLTDPLFDVPFNLLYKNGLPFEKQIGLFAPIAKDALLKANSKAYGLKKGVPVHYLTARSRHSDARGNALQNFVQIVQSGGLKPIQERSRMGILLKTVSPGADVNMGVDDAVPARIYKKSNFAWHLRWFAGYNAQIAIVFKKEIMQQRDVWFIDYDPLYRGARFFNYDQYMSHIGHRGSFRSSPSAQVRARHLKEGTSHGLNEIWFKGEVHNHQMAGVLTSSAMVSVVKEKVEEFKQQGILEPDFYVKNIGTGYFSAVRKKQKA